MHVAKCEKATRLGTHFSPDKNHPLEAKITAYISINIVIRTEIKSFL